MAKGVVELHSRQTLESMGVEVLARGSSVKVWRVCWVATDSDGALPERGKPLIHEWIARSKTRLGNASDVEFRFWVEEDEALNPE